MIDYGPDWRSYEGDSPNESGDRVMDFPKVQNGQGEVAQGLADADDRPFTLKLDAAITSGSIDSVKVVTAYHVYDNS